MKQYAAAWTMVVLAVTSSWAEEDGPSAAGVQGIEGTLVICGGGRLPEEVIGRFVEAAGGPKANLVLVPTASSFADRADPERYLAPWRERVASVTLLHTRSRETADQDDFVTPLRQATAVWFYGGSQSRLAASYVDTKFERELHALLKRGGTIGGTSAGAAIMSRLMIARGRQEPEFGIGFDLLPDAVIDQHFLRRGRQPRLLAALEKNPDHFGVGIDEGTALVVEGSSMRVVGESVVTVCLASSPGRERREVTLPSGAEADLPSFRRAARNLTAAAPPAALPAAADPLARTSSLSASSGAR
jgi:cyanophycinase